MAQGLQQRLVAREGEDGFVALAQGAVALGVQRAGVQLQQHIARAHALAFTHVQGDHAASFHSGDHLAALAGR